MESLRYSKYTQKYQACKFLCPPQGLLLYWSHRSHWPRASTKWGPPNITHLVFLLLGNTHFVKQIFRFQHYYFRLNISLFSSYLVFASSWPICLILSVSLLAWAIKESIGQGSQKAEQVLGASKVFLAQGLPKAGEGPRNSPKEQKITLKTLIQIQLQQLKLEHFCRRYSVGL